MVYNLGLGSSLPKKNVGDQNRRGLDQGSIQKIWDPYLFLQPLKLATSNLVHNLGFGLSYQKTTFRTKIGERAWERGASEKIWDPLFISATVEASDLKIGTQHEFRFTLPNTSLCMGSELREYHSPPHYDDDATMYFTCDQKLTGTQISLLSGNKQKI